MIIKPIAEQPIDNFLNYVLSNRGIKNPEEFLDTDSLLKYIHSPNLLTHIDEGATLYLNNLKQGNKILFIVDCDNDGYTSAAMLWNYTKMIFPNSDLSYFLHSGKQHGLEDMVDRILDLDDYPDLVVIPDAGTNDCSYHKELYDKNIGILVLDHHQFNFDPAQETRYAVIINNQDGKYPNSSLSGAGVVLKFCEYLDELLKLDNAKYYYDLAAVGIVGDMMDLRDPETQYIVRKGLSDIHNTGLVELVKAQAYSLFSKPIIGPGELSELTPTDISFFIVPLTNALIRVGREAEKETLFLALTSGKITVPSTKRGDKGMETIAAQNARNCINARARQNRTKEKALESFEMQIIQNNLLRNKILFLDIDDGDCDIDSALTGLVAMQILSKYRRPVIVARKNQDGYYRGSARGMDNSELTDLRAFFLESGMFEYAEGHPNAHGVSIHSSNVESFIEYANETLKDTNFEEGIYFVDFLFSKPSLALSNAIVEIGKQKKLWGKGIEEPVFAVDLPNISIGDFTFMKNNTIKLSSEGTSFIKFRGANLEEDLKHAPKRFNMRIIGRASINEWMGTSYPQIVIDAYEILDNSLDF